MPTLGIDDHKIPGVTSSMKLNVVRADDFTVRHATRYVACSPVASFDEGEGTVRRTNFGQEHKEFEKSEKIGVAVIRHRSSIKSVGCLFNWRPCRP